MSHAKITTGWLAAVFVLMLAGDGRAADPWDADAVYAARVAELTRAIDANPKDPQPLADLAAFYLKPLAPRDVAAVDGQVRRVMVPLRNQWKLKLADVYSVKWVFRGDPAKAKPLIDRAIALDSKHAGALRAMAMYHGMRSNVDAMEPYVIASLANNPNDLDMCRLHLDHEMGVAHNLDIEAGLLRDVQVQEVDGPNGTRIRRTFSPTQFALDRAAALDARAKEVRRNSIEPLRQYVKNLQAAQARQADPKLKSQEMMANAIYYAWLGEGGKAVTAAMRALESDPTNLDALDFLIDILDPRDRRGVQQQYKAILDKWRGADSAPIILEETPRRGVRR